MSVGLRLDATNGRGGIGLSEVGLWSDRVRLLLGLKMGFGSGMKSISVAPFPG